MSGTLKVPDIEKNGSAPRHGCGWWKRVSMAFWCGLTDTLSQGKSFRIRLCQMRIDTRFFHTKRPCRCRYPSMDIKLPVKRLERPPLGLRPVVSLTALVQESNLISPMDFQSMVLYQSRPIWSRRRELNPLQSDYESDALPNELLPGVRKTSTSGTHAVIKLCAPVRNSRAWTAG